MKTKKIIYLIAFNLLSIICQAQINDKIAINRSDFQTQNVKGYDKIVWKTNNTTREIGKPELPVYRVSYVLPVDAFVTGVNFTTQEKQKLNDQFYLLPVQQPIPTDNTQSVIFTEPNSSVYLSDTPYPNKLYDIESDKFFQGYHIVTLRIYPFEYIPKSKVLNYYSNLEYSIQYASGTNAGEIKPLTQTVGRAESCKSLVKSLVQNPGDVDTFGSNVQSLQDDKKTVQQSSGMQKAKALSLYDEITPDYIIITNNALKSTFQTLADWKTKKGLFTIIETTEDIDANYSGSDLQEKIRTYIIEAYTKWGSGLYVLLGGGVNIVPARMVLGGDDTDNFPADMYYSTYTGNWNANGNNLFQELNDMEPLNASYSMGVILGRIPIINSSEAGIYINKIIAYEKAADIGNLNYLKNNLYSDAYLGPVGAAPTDQLNTFAENSIKSIVTNYVPTYINNRFICDDALCTGLVSRYPLSTSCPEGDIELNNTNFISCLNTGTDVGKFHIIYHMDHGSSQGIATSGIDKGKSVSKVDMGSLANGTSYQILMSGSCHSADFSQDCIAKYYLASSGNGGVAWIGNTDSGYTNEWNQLQYFCDAIYNKKIYDIGSAFQNILIANGSNYQSDWRLHLLGDPQMQVWTNVPQALTVTGIPAAILLGNQSITVNISNLPAGVKAVTCIQKGTEVFTTEAVTGTGSSINLPMNFTVDTPGSVNVTVTAHNFFPYETTMTANQTTAPNVYISDVDFGDSIAPGIGDGNGKNDAGETIDLSVGVKNTGINQANGVTATLNCSSPYISVLNNQASFGSIASGAETTSHFLYSINKNTPEILENAKSPIQFSVVIQDVNNVIWKDTFNIDIFNDSIIQRNKTMPSRSDGTLLIVAGQINTINIDLQNIGQAQAVGLKAILTRDATKDINGYISCPPIEKLYPPLNQFSDSTSTAPYQFTVSNNYPGGTTPLWFNLQVTNAYGKIWNLPFNLMDKPGTVSGIDFTSDVSEIDLTWTKSIDAAGYNIYRCDADQINETEVGSYVKLNNTPVSFSFYNDSKNLTSLTKYYYKVASVSTTGNEGPATRLLTWTSYPHKNLYPVTMDAVTGYLDSPFNVADVNYDGKKEIFVGTNAPSSRLIALDYYGNELDNIDNDITTKVGFSVIGKRGTGIPAIADTRQDGKFKLIEPTRDQTSGATANNSIYCFTFDINSNSQPNLDWSYTPQDLCFRGAVVANIDNSADGSMETVTCSDNGVINIYSNNGALLHTINSGASYGAIAVADIDGDVSGHKEIIQASGTDINVWNYDGSNYRGGNSPSLYHLSSSGYRFASSVIVCNIDGQKEILTFATNKTNNSTPFNAKLFAIKNDGSLVPGFDGTQTIQTYNYWTENQEIAVGDLNNDGHLEVVTFAIDGIKVWDHTGQLILPISSKTITDIATASTPILADVDTNHSDAEIIFSSPSTNNICAYKLDGSSVLGFPLKGGGGGICVADVDNDGKNELIAGSASTINMWQTNGIPSRIEWGSQRHDQFNTGEYQTICDPLIISRDSICNSSLSICGDMIVKSGTLTINNSSNVTLGSSSMIIVMSGASLVIDSGNVLNANVRAMAGSSVTIKNNGSIKLRTNAEFYTETGTIVDFPYGSIGN